MDGPLLKSLLTQIWNHVFVESPHKFQLTGKIS